MKHTCGKTFQRLTAARELVFPAATAATAATAAETETITALLTTDPAPAITA